MKKTLLYFITAIAIITSCQQKEKVGPTGATGATGTNGTNGKDGNANVTSFFYTTKESDWTGNGQIWTCTISNVTNLTKAVVDSGMVSVILSAGTERYALPYLLPVTNNDFVSYLFEYSQGVITLKYIYPSGLAGNANPGIKDFKIITTTSN